MAEVVALSGYPELQHLLFKMLGLVVAAHAVALQACGHQLHGEGFDSSGASVSRKVSWADSV
ncbi:MAG: hypothetical protein FP819_27395 [Rhizobiaceae bacterium]|nr:hypothetical protein [Rhizobiaceae bacterium]